MKMSRNLARTYIMADKFGDIVAANMVVDEIIRFADVFDEITYEGTIAEVVQKLPLDSPISKLYVDLFVYSISADWICYVSERAILPPAFLFKTLEEKTRLCDENLNKQVCKVFPVMYVSRNKCRYHQHDDEHPKCAKA